MNTYYKDDMNTHSNGNGYSNEVQQNYQQQRPSSGLNQSRSVKQMPYLNQKSQYKVQPKTKEERDIAIKHLISPTKSLQLRSEVIKSSKELQKQMLFKNSRVLDNHYLERVHSTPWKSPGLFHRQKYESDDTGIAITFPENAYESKMNQDRQEVTKMQSDGFRNWTEYNQIRDNESIVTIEYCTNCHEHQGTTRHDEKKYEFIASNLKKELLRHYPLIKVYMKPLITENQDHSIENIYARARLGAMEVQICTNRGGKIEKNILFSKLKTKSWPSTLNVLNEVRKFMDKCTLTVQLIHEFIDPQSLRDDQKRTSENKLFNVEVVLRPYRKINQAGYTQQINQSTYGNGQSQIFGEGDKSQMFGSRIGYDSTVKSRPGSAIRRTNARPLSAQSAYTVQSYSQLPQSDGFLPHGKSIEIKEKSSPEGIVTFKDLPFDVYSLEIRETNDYRACKDRIDIFKKSKESYQNTIHHEILLEPVELTFAKIILEVQPDPTTKEKVSESTIRICKEGDEENELEGKITKVFETTLDPGKYKIVIENPNLGRVERYHTFQFGNQELKISFDKNDVQDYQQSFNNSSQKKPANPNNRPSSARPQSGNSNVKKELIIQVYEAGNYSNYIKDCKIKIKDEKKGTQVFSTIQDGTCIIRLDGYSKGIIKIKHEDFLVIKEEYGPNTMNINNMKELSFPLVRKPDSDNEVNLLMLTDTDRKIMTLNVITPDGIPISSSKKEVQIDNNQEQRSSLIKISKVKETKGVYRIFAKIHDISLLTPSSVKLYVITSSKKMHFVEVPKSHPQFNRGTDIYWDIGALCVPDCKFIEINSTKIEPVTKDSYLPQLKQISDFFHKVQKKDKSKGSDVRSLLGFPNDDPKVLQYNNDYFVQKDKIIDSLVKNVFGGQPNPFIEHLINSALLTNGLYSFNKLKSKFDNISFPEGLDIQNDGSVKEVKQEDEEDE